MMMMRWLEPRRFVLISSELESDRLCTGKSGVLPLVRFSRWDPPTLVYLGVANKSRIRAPYIFYQSKVQPETSSQ